MRKEIWYSVENGGDGSAYPKFMESKELCELDQRYMDEGWGEYCVGSLVVESDSPITVHGVETAEMVKKQIEEELRYDYNGEKQKKRYREKLEKVNVLLRDKFRQRLRKRDGT